MKSETNASICNPPMPQSPEAVPLRKCEVHQPAQSAWDGPALSPFGRARASLVAVYESLSPDRISRGNVRNSLSRSATDVQLAAPGYCCFCELFRLAWLNVPGAVARHGSLALRSNCPWNCFSTRSGSRLRSASSLHGIQDGCLRFEALASAAGRALSVWFVSLPFCFRRSP